MRQFQMTFDFENGVLLKSESARNDDSGSNSVSGAVNQDGGADVVDRKNSLLWTLASVDNGGVERGGVERGGVERDDGRREDGGGAAARDG